MNDSLPTQGQEAAHLRPPGYIEPGTKCANCEQREATQAWVGEGSALDFNHGFWKPWCDYCATEAQLDYALRIAKNIPDLEKKLKGLADQ